MREIQLHPLKRGYVALVDDEDYGRVAQFKWYARVAKTKTVLRVYAVHMEESRGKRQQIAMHRFITGSPVRLDHKDANGLNNQRHNLRPATTSQNAANKRLSIGRSKFKGVSWSKSNGNWTVRITLNGVRRALGSFDKDDETTAALVYDYAARKLFGEFARCNFPDIAEPPSFASEIDARLVAAHVYRRTQDGKRAA